MSCGGGGWFAPAATEHREIEAQEHYARRVAERGEIANPLLWTHAMYLVMWHLAGSRG